MILAGIVTIHNGEKQNGELNYNLRNEA